MPQAVRKICKQCRRPFISGGSKPGLLYCSSECRHEYERARHYPRSPYKSAGMNPSTTGALSEMRTAVDLMLRGYEVFRPVSPSATCDLIGLRYGILVRFQVRTGWIGAGKLRYAKKDSDEGRQDHFAVCLPHEIVYIPGLPE